MYNFSPRCRLLGGILAIGLGALILPGCQDTSQPTTGPSVAFVATAADPTTPTADDLAQAGAAPSNPADAVATMSAPELSTSSNAMVTPSGTESALLVDCGNTGTASGSLPLEDDAGRICGKKPAVLPKGDSAIYFSPGTSCDLDDLGDIAAFAPGNRHALRISSFKVLFSVHDSRPPTWTLPSSYIMNMRRHKNMFVLDDSFLQLRWNGIHSIPPKDNQVTITANLYNGTKKVAGPLIKTVTVQKDTALFTSDTNVDFNQATVTIDLRDVK